MMVSYVRARAGGLRVDCEVGVFTRPERVAAMGAGLIAGQWVEGVLLVVLGATAGLTAITTGAPPELTAITLLIPIVQRLLGARSPGAGTGIR